jgi:hypothetical protein
MHCLDDLHPKKGEVVSIKEGVCDSILGPSIFPLNPASFENFVNCRSFNVYHFFLNKGLMHKNVLKIVFLCKDVNNFFNFSILINCFKS